MILRRWILGELESNAYLLMDDTEGKALVIDPGGDPSPIVEFIQESGADLLYILNTHGHADHIAGNGVLKRLFPHAKILIHENDTHMLTSPAMNLSLWLGKPVVSPEADGYLREGDSVKIGSLELEVIHTPGHTAGSVCFYLKKEGVLFSGDTLFRRSVGRTDFPGGSWGALISSIKDKLFKLPLSTRVCPGHGDETSIGEEMHENPFLV